MFIQVKKLLTAKNKQGFTLLELTVSLFLLVILTLLLMLILQTTITTSKRFLDYTNYEYGLAHKNNSAKVKQEHNYILLKSKDELEDVKVNFRGDRVYIDKFKDSNSSYFAGYIMLLRDIKHYSLSQENDTIHVIIIDKNDNKREMYLKVKNEKTDKEKAKEEKEKKEKQDKEKITKDNNPKKQGE